MVNLLKRLFRITDAPAAEAPSPQAMAPTARDARPSREAATPAPELARGGPTRDAINRYFELSIAIIEGKRDHDYARAIRAARATYEILPAVVRQWKREYGRFDINTSHAVHTAPELMAAMEDRDGIRELRAVLESVKDLRDWLPSAERAEADVEVVPQIMALVRADPGILQSTLKTRIPSDAASEPGTRASNLAAWLEKAGRIQRVKKGSSYQLYPAGYQIQPPASPRPSASSPSSCSPLRFSSSMTSSSSPSSSSNSPSSALAAARPPRAPSQRAATKARLLDFSGLPVIRLPKAPASWEERAAREERDGETGATSAAKRGVPNFVVEAQGWTVAAEEKLAPVDRPDPAFREVFPTGRFSHWLDPKGKREGFEYAASVLRVTDREGLLVAERGLTRDTYRSAVNVDGTGILFLSRGGTLHGYTETLDPFIEEHLADLPEYQAQADRFGLEEHEIKNHTRCIAISAGRARYLVTVVDEAWCVDTESGQVVWGCRMPSKEGWTRVVADRSESAGTSAEVDAALELMGLKLPMTPDDITKQYRTLAMRWHPDRNPADREATARFQELGAAMELLTGADLTGLRLWSLLR